MSLRAYYSTKLGEAYLGDSALLMPPVAIRFRRSHRHIAPVSSYLSKKEALFLDGKANEASRGFYSAPLSKSRS